MSSTKRQRLLGPTTADQLLSVFALWTVVCIILWNFVGAGQAQRTIMATVWLFPIAVLVVGSMRLKHWSSVLIALLLVPYPFVVGMWSDRTIHLVFASWKGLPAYNLAADRIEVYTVVIPLIVFVMSAEKLFSSWGK